MLLLESSGCLLCSCIAHSPRCFHVVSVKVNGNHNPHDVRLIVEVTTKQLSATTRLTITMTHWRPQPRLHLQPADSATKSGKQHQLISMLPEKKQQQPSIFRTSYIYPANKNGRERAVVASVPLDWWKNALHFGALMIHNVSISSNGWHTSIQPPCKQCTHRTIKLLGFVSIPMFLKDCSSRVSK